MYIKYIKRIIDLILVLLAIPFFLVFYIVFAILIKIEDNGPVFYKAERIGKNNKIFKMYKFRSMKVNAPNILNPDGSTYNAKNDPRVTKIGKFLRENSLDEIPQILNIIKGEMSIIGPRASLAGALGTFKKDEVDKMKVLPGITGFTQAYFRNDLPNREKRLKDAWYANNVSLCLDLKILSKTISTIVKRKGIYSNV